jgi:threonine aldolase
VLDPGAKSFGSDNHAGVHPAVLAAISAANGGDAASYGQDGLTRAAAARLCKASGAHDAYLVFNGTGANVLGLSLLLRPYEAVICTVSAHLAVDECAAPERVLGAKLLPVPAPDGKLTPDLIAGQLGDRGDEHRAQARVVALAQATELGTCYSLRELHAIRDFCAANDLLIYIDGARIANAAAYLGCSLADIAACADVLSFGGTKNGALGVEAVLVMTERLAPPARFQRKQLMQLASKMRFLAAQADALLTDDLWLDNARRANAMARRLADGLAAMPGVRLTQAVEANGVFAEIDRRHAERLAREWHFEIWSHAGDGRGGREDRRLVRWMTSFDTSAADVDQFLAAVRATSFT